MTKQAWWGKWSEMIWDDLSISSISDCHTKSYCSQKKIWIIFRCWWIKEWVLMDFGYLFGVTILFGGTYKIPIWLFSLVTDHLPSQVARCRSKNWAMQLRWASCKNEGHFSEISCKNTHQMITLWLCQNSYWKWPFIVSFPIKHVDFP